jgi:uncharacterized heparinase superfamily protein
MKVVMWKCRTGRASGVLGFIRCSSWNIVCLLQKLNHIYSHDDKAVVSGVDAMDVREFLSELKWRIWEFFSITTDFLQVVERNKYYSRRTAAVISMPATKANISV